MLSAVKVSTDQAEREFDATVLCYMQPSNVTIQQYADDPVVDLCWVPDLYDKGTLNKVVIIGADTSTRYNSRYHWQKKSSS